MFLSDLIQKEITVGKTVRGVCVGLGVSLKNYAVKYLLCSTRTATNPDAPMADFAVNLSAVEYFDEQKIQLSRLRAVFPKNCAKLFLSKPVFSDEGLYMGTVCDVEMQNFVLVRLYTDKNVALPFTAVAAYADGVLLRKKQPYPIGERIPAPSVLQNNEQIVTKPLLKTAIENGKLIRLTLSLAPFRFSKSAYILPTVSKEQKTYR